jgi:hypothetical protein
MTTEYLIGEMSSPRRYYLGTEQGIMQNKPNLLNAKMNVTPVITKHYGQKSPLRPPAKQTQTNPIKPNFYPSRLYANCAVYHNIGTANTAGS